MFKINKKRQLQIADTVLNNETYRQMGDQLKELNQQYIEIGERKDAYQDVRDFIRDKILIRDDASKRFEIYSVLFDSLAKECEALERVEEGFFDYDDTRKIYELNSMDKVD